MNLTNIGWNSLGFVTCWAIQLLISRSIRGFNDQRQQVFTQLNKVPAWIARGAFSGKSWQEREMLFDRQVDKERTVLLVPPSERSVKALISVGFLPM